MNFNLCTTLLFLSINIFAQNPIEEFIYNPLLQNANISFLVSDVRTGEVVCEHRACNMAVPASTMKVITTATALELLGADFRFRTLLEMDEKPTADSVLNGNIIIRGTGDPTLGSAFFPPADFLNNWVLAVKNAGIKTIRGQIIVDEQKFETEGVNPHWLWEDIGNYYAAGIYGIAYKDNTYTLTLQSKEAGTQPVIVGVEPKISNLTFDNFLTASTSGGDNAYIRGLPKSYNKALYGTIPQKRKSFTIKGDIPNPALLLKDDFVEKLKAAGITVENQTVKHPSLSEFPLPIYTQYSPKLIDIITLTNFRSNNNFAEHIFKYLSLTKFNIATVSNAVSVVKSFWESKGLPVNQLLMRDGSGLSPQNAVSANFLVELLNYMQNKSQFANQFKQSLPAAGIEGTVASVLKNSALQGRVRMKSGTISQVRCYAGYMDLTDGQTLSFAVLVNNANGSSREVTAEIEKLLLNVEENVENK